MILLDFEVEASLEIHPESVGCSEESRQAKSGVGRDPSLAVNDLVDSARRHVDCHGQSILCHAKRDEEISETNIYRYTL